MANTTPESAFQQYNSKIATIVVYDGHTIDAADLQKAIKGGFVHFYNWKDESDTDLICSKVALSDKELASITEKLNNEQGGQPWGK